MNYNVSPCRGQGSHNLPGALHVWQDRHAFPSCLQTLQLSILRASGILGIPSDGVSALALPNLISGVKTAQVTWTQLLFAVRFKGSRGLTGRLSSSCRLRKNSASSMAFSLSLRSRSRSFSARFRYVLVGPTKLCFVYSTGQRMHLYS